MYFSTVLVLLLTCKFMQLQPIQPPVEDIIPFGYKYIPGTGEFLKSVMHDFKTFPTEKLKIYMSDFLQRNLYDSSKLYLNINCIDFKIQVHLNLSELYLQQKTNDLLVRTVDRYFKVRE